MQTRGHLNQGQVGSNANLNVGYGKGARDCRSGCPRYMANLVKLQMLISTMKTNPNGIFSYIIKMYIPYINPRE